MVEERFSTQYLSPREVNMNFVVVDGFATWLREWSLIALSEDDKTPWANLWTRVGAWQGLILRVYSTKADLYRLVLVETLFLHFRPVVYISLFIQSQYQLIACNHVGLCRKVCRWVSSLSLSLSSFMIA